MKIKRLVIENFKSIERIELIEPNPFTVFVGPNGSGKSNIFEALEFVNLQERVGGTTGGLFGGPESFLRKQKNANQFTVILESDAISFERGYHRNVVQHVTNETAGLETFEYKNKIISGASGTANNTFHNFARLFIGKDEIVKLRFNDDQRLSLSAKNLEKVLKRVLSEPILSNEIFEWLQLFVPEFKNVEVVANPFSGEETLLWYEQYAEKPFTKNLISDGTYNILAILTAVYQSDDKPQFLCIEEPENGLHPQVAGELIDFFRIMCEERGHHIWLNTHSQSMISRVRPEELIIVDKKQGATRVKQISKDDFKNWRMDEALLMNAFGGGLPW